MRRSVNRFMILAFIVLSRIDFVDCAATFYDTYAPFAEKLDEGAAKTCFMLNGQIEQFNPNSIDQGYKCTYTANVWTTDRNAKEFCESNTPYPIIPALVQSINGGRTQCGYWITLKCKNDWWQIDGLCYKVIEKFTFSDAKTYCETKLEHKDTEPKLAEFYSTSLGMFLEHLSFSEVWVTVPDITEYFLDGVGEAALFVNDGAFKYDTKQGTIIMGDVNKEHAALCQYKPAITMAEVYRRAKEFEEIYPIYTQDNGINVVTSSYLTVNQRSARKFDANEIREQCKAIGKIIDVESFPVAPVESEWNEARAHVKGHRFYLTSAFKNDGCDLTDFRNYDISSETEGVVFPDSENKYRVCNAFSYVFNENRRAPSMAGMRAPAICALHSYSFKDAICDSDWIEYIRDGNARFCHYYTDHIGNYDQSQAACVKLGASLTGFDSEAELDAILQRKPSHAEHVKYLGAVVPCEVDCHYGYVASWNQGVARNTHFLNRYRHGGVISWWSDKHDKSIVSLCGDDVQEFHSHNKVEWSGISSAICGKYARFSSKKIETNRP